MFSGEVIAGFQTDTAFTAGGIDTDGSTITAGDGHGAVHLLRLEAVEGEVGLLST